MNDNHNPNAVQMNRYLNRGLSRSSDAAFVAWAIRAGREWDDDVLRPLAFDVEREGVKP